MSKEDVLTKLKSDIRSLLISSKEGLSSDRLRRDYEDMLGKPLPLKPLGFRHVMDMVREMPDVVSINYRIDGTFYLTAVSDESTQNIAELVAKQRSVKKNSKKFSNNFAYYHKSNSVVLPRRGCAPPALPAQLRSQLRILLSKEPVRLSALEASYLRCFGHPLNVHSYGFYSTGEMLEKVSDLVCIQQTRLGSVLMLREHMMPRMPLKSLDKPKNTGPMKRNVVPLNKLFPKVPSNKVHLPSEVAVTANAVREDRSYKQLFPTEWELNGLACSDKPEVAEETQDTQAVSNTESRQFTTRVLKLEEELRQQIIENGVAGAVSQELKDKLRKVVGEMRGGLSIHDLPSRYKKLFDEDLPLSRSGFVSVTELVGALTDMFILKPAEDHAGNRSIIVHLKDGNNTQSVENDNLSNDEDMSPQTPPLKFCKSFWDYKGEESHDDISSDEKEEAETTISKAKEMISEMYPAVQVHLNPSLPLDVLQNQRLKPPTHHGLRQLVEVLVESVVSPALFYLRFIESEESRALEDMMIEMKRNYTCPDVSGRYQLPAQFIRQGQVCCVLTESTWFYRVVIHRVISPTEVEAYFVDFGNMSMVQTANLKFLKSRYSVLPAQAVPSSLSGIKPFSGSWSVDAVESFKTLCFERTLVGALDCYSGDVLQLFLCDTSTNQDIYVHDVLLSQGHGTVCSPAASAALSTKITPVGLYMGEGMIELPEIDVEEILSAKSAETSLLSTEDAQKEVGEDPLPELEAIEIHEAVPEPENMDSSYNGLFHGRSSSHGNSSDVSTAEPAKIRPPSPTPTHMECPIPSKTCTIPIPTPAQNHSLSSFSTPQEEQLSKTPGSFLAEPPLILRMLGPLISPLAHVQNKKADSPLQTLGLRHSGTCFPLFGSR